MHTRGRGISIMGRCAVTGEVDEEEGAAAGAGGNKGWLASGEVQCLCLYSGLGNVVHVKVLLPRSRDGLISIMRPAQPSPPPSPLPHRRCCSGRCLFICINNISLTNHYAGGGYETRVRA